MKLTEVLFASHNAGKIAEITQMLEPFGIQVKSAAESEANAIRNAEHAIEESIAALIRLPVRQKNVRIFPSQILFIQPPQILRTDSLTTLPNTLRTAAAAKTMSR